MNESDQADMTCPHCGSPYMPRAGWAANSANQFVPTITCSACGQPWTTPAKPTGDRELRTKLEEFAKFIDDKRQRAEDKWDEYIDADRESTAYYSGKALALAAVYKRLRQLLAEDSTQEVNK